MYQCAMWSCSYVFNGLIYGLRATGRDVPIHVGTFNVLVVCDHSAQQTHKQLKIENSSCTCCPQLRAMGS